MRIPSDQREKIEKGKISRYYEETRKYYESELRYLYGAGEAFAKMHGNRADHLRLKVPPRDPYVETLLQGFAFLTGRIQQKLDDEIPEFTSSLLGLLWPHVLRPIPSLAILEFTPKEGSISETRRLERGTLVSSNAINGVACQFQTSYDVWLQPLTIKNARLEGPSVITFALQLWDGVQYQQLNLKSLRLFIASTDPPTASELHFALTHNVKEVTLKAGFFSKTLTGEAGVRPVGFSPDESLFPYPDYSFSGYRLLLEYFAFRQKFFFVELRGLEQLPENTTSIEVRVSLSQPFPANKPFTAGDFRLHCTPIVNLFQQGADSISLDRRSTEYEVVASRSHPGTAEVYSVDSVESENNEYVSFYSFRHAGETADSSSYPPLPLRRRGRRYYHLSTRPTADGQLRTYLSFADEPEETAGGNRVFREETLTVLMTCTNGNLPNALPEPAGGSICQHPGGEKGAPEWTRFRNLTHPTLPIYPPLGEGFEWRLISHMGLNTLSLLSAESLRAILELYEWEDNDGKRLHIRGIANVNAKPKEIFSGGTFYRGIEVEIEVRDENFLDMGDLHLFGLVLHEFLSLYASINTFVQLTFLRHSNKERLLTWTSKKGKGFLI